EIAGRHATARRRVHDAHLEAVAAEPEVALDAIDEPLDGRVRADRAPAPPGAVRAREPRLESLLIRVAQEALERAPARPLQLLQRLSLGHRRSFASVSVPSTTVVSRAFTSIVRVHGSYRGSR